MRKVAVTMGEPGGIGPEVVVKALSAKSVRLMCSPVVIGDARVMKSAMALVKSPLRLRVIGHPSEGLFERNTIEVIQSADPRGFRKRRPTPEGGRACFEYIKKAAELAEEGAVDALCTAPISKEALGMAGIPFPGHTEMLTRFAGVTDFGMMLVGGPLRVLLVTTHKSIREVPGLVTKKAVLDKIILASKAASMLGIRRPKIAVCGLNPHAGEGGLFGNEDALEIAPAVEEARRMRINASGPHPPDAIFRKAYMGETDIVVAMYHDQGLIPLKMIAFEKGVNITVGLPFIRTSPDHGTAYDIAWRGKASPASMIEALKYAAGLKIEK